MRFLVIISQSLAAIKANLLRASVTIFIIALGIASLVGVLTSIEGIKFGMTSSFSSLGTNTFRVRNRASEVRFGGPRRSRREVKPNITWRQALHFKENFSIYAPVSMTVSGGRALKATSGDRSTNANLTLVGTDENYMQTARYELAEGRTLSPEDVELGRKVVVLGGDVKETLFPYGSSLGQSVMIGGKIYQVVGAFESMGTTGMSGGDKIIITPISALRSVMEDIGSITLNVYVEDPSQLDFLMEEARGTFRRSRQLDLREPDNFDIARSDAFVEQLLGQLASLTIAAQVVAIITLLGASVALLNVMLVSVTERTMEIGLRKALGASKRAIRQQFLSEAIVICQIGGVLGILMGLGVGNLLGIFLLKGSVVIPWGWVITGLIACLVVGIASGYYPAYKASQVDPIESLRTI